MNQSNPYEYRPAEVGENGEEEMFDHEARVRIAEALHASHFPMMCFAILLLLAGFLVGGLVLMSVIMSTRVTFSSTDAEEVMGFIAAIGIPTTLSVFLICVAGWLWSCAIALDRARKRLSIATVAAAVQAQSLFWSKAGKLAVVLILICGVCFGTLFVLEEM